MPALETPLTSRDAPDSAVVIGDEWKVAIPTVLLAQGLLEVVLRLLAIQRPVVTLPFQFDGTSMTPLGTVVNMMPSLGVLELVLHGMLLVVACAFVHRLTRLDHVPGAASRAAWLVALSPLGVLIMADLVFALTFVISAGALLSARRGFMLSAGVAAATAALLSPFAAVVWIGVLYEFFRLKMWRGANAASAIGLLLPAVIVLGWTVRVAGAAHAPVMEALITLVTGRPTWGPIWIPSELGGIVTLATAALLGVASLIAIVEGRRLRKSYLIVTFAFVTAGLLGGSATSTLHALALAFPLATMLGVETYHRPMFERPLVAGCALASLCLYLM